MEKFSLKEPARGTIGGGTGMHSLVALLLGILVIILAFYLNHEGETFKAIIAESLEHRQPARTCLFMSVLESLLHQLKYPHQRQLRRPFAASFSQGNLYSAFAKTGVVLRSCMSLTTS